MKTVRRKTFSNDSQTLSAPKVLETPLGNAAQNEGAKASNVTPPILSRLRNFPEGPAGSKSEAKKQDMFSLTTSCHGWLLQ